MAGRPRCRAAAAAACCCYCCLACLLLLRIIVVLLFLLLCASVACSRTYGASSRELGERHASCDIPLCCYSYSCCECFYVLPLLLLLLLLSVMHF